MKSAKQLTAALVIIVCCFGAIYSLSNFLERSRTALPESYGDSDLEFEGKRLKGFVFGSEGLLADWYWIKSLQYIGDKMVRSEGDYNLDDLRSLNPRLLYPYLDNATDLDSHFLSAYNYGATVLPAIDSRLAIKLTEKGISNNPDNWRLYHYLGYIYWRQRDYAKASQAYDTGSRITGAAPFMQMMAAAMRTEGGSSTTARSLYSQMAQTADESIRGSAELRLKELDWFDEQAAIDNVLATYKQANGNCPVALSDIAKNLMRITLPGGRHFSVDNKDQLVDPMGTPYLFDRSECRVKLDVENTRLPKPMAALPTLPE